MTDWKKPVPESLQTDVHAGLYLGRLRCCLSLSMLVRSVYVSLSISVIACLC